MGAVLLFVVALFLLLGGFGTGGPLPKGLFKGTYAVFGWAAYFVPFALGYWGAVKFIDEDHRIPLGKYFSVILGLLFTSGLFFALFASKATDDAAWANGHGGTAGEILGKAVLTALDKLPAALLFIVLITMTVFWIFGISPKVL
ncbi:MAG TPA: DNA translocase FtsK 4TM domain-containing protein, partial [Ktedonobacteraceae bacterium]|nr:DNA translocase FtsK 4TM domain-containing protein [Ktedonobacteraceae bacterium]